MVVMLISSPFILTAADTVLGLLLSGVSGNLRLQLSQSDIDGLNNRLFGNGVLMSNSLMGYLYQFSNEAGGTQGVMIDGKSIIEYLYSLRADILTTINGKTDQTMIDQLNSEINNINIFLDFFGARNLSSDTYANYQYMSVNCQYMNLQQDLGLIFSSLAPGYISSTSSASLSSISSEFASLQSNFKTLVNSAQTINDNFPILQSDQN
jgi:hypothetical protein